MAGDVTVSLGALLSLAGFILQAGLTVAAIAFSHGALNQRVRAVEEKVRDHGLLATSVTRLETEMEGVSREIKGLREDLRRNEARFRPYTAPAQRPRRSPYDTPPMRDWVEDEGWST